MVDLFCPVRTDLFCRASDLRYPWWQDLFLRVGRRRVNFFARPAVFGTAIELDEPFHGVITALRRPMRARKRALTFGERGFTFWRPGGSRRRCSFQSRQVERFPGRNGVRIRTVTGGGCRAGE